MPIGIILVVTTIIGLILLIMAIPMETPTTMLEVPPLNLNSCSNSLLVNKLLSTRPWRESLKLLNVEKNISSLSEAQSSLINKMVAKPKTMESAFAATHAIQVTIDENVRLLAQLHAKWEREAEIDRNNSVCTITRMDTTKPQVAPIPPPNMPKPSEPTTSDAKFDFDIVMKMLDS